MIIIRDAVGRDEATLAAVIRSIDSGRSFGACGESIHVVLIETQALDDLVGVACVSSLKKLLDVDRELNRITRRSGTEVIQASLEAILPSIEVHGGHLGKVCLCHVDVEAL